MEDPNMGVVVHINMWLNSSGSKCQKVGYVVSVLRKIHTYEGVKKLNILGDI